MTAKTLDRAAKMILAAKCPLIMVGGAASRLDEHSIAQLRDIARRLGIPYFATQLGKGVMAEDSDLYMGTAALSKGDHVHVAVDKADLIIAVGYDKCEKPPFIMSEGGPEVIHIAHQPASFTQAYRPHLEVIGDIGASVAALADRLEGKLPNAGALLPLREGILALNCDGADEEIGLVTLDGLVHAVRKVMGEKDIVALDNGLYKIPFARGYRTNHPKTLLLDNTLATMGAGVPSAIVAAMLNLGLWVMGVCGDGGFQMTGQELMTAVEQKLDLVVLILDNGGWGMIEAKQIAKGFPKFGVDFRNPDFVKWAEACGAKGTRVETLDDLMPALEAALKGGGVHVVAVPVDDSKYKRLVGEFRSPKAKPSGV
jgi:acetolactate synthase-1/2/3 large subunit